MKLTENILEELDQYTKDFQENILQLSVQRKGSFMMHREWVNLASRFIRQKNEWQIDYFVVRSAESFLLPKAEQESIERIYHYFYQLNLEEQQQFLREWYEAMDETWTWDQVLELLKEWR
ncbi:hypothetical protein [Caldalkalibacillus uzonensis]|uniref:hypothetical protein n=1 Tax=Caldalkalibacillus uzonensis TaxID=353224 RepID=UPI0027D8AEB5|nr:hypothetical protein [Caldalkalibacillus uzonensis]